MDPKWQFHVLIYKLPVQLFRVYDVLSAPRVSLHALVVVYLLDPILFIERRLECISIWFGKCMYLPQRNLRNCRRPNSRESSFHVVAYRMEVNMELDHVEQIMLEDLVAGTASFLWIYVSPIMNSTAANDLYSIPELPYSGWVLYVFDEWKQFSYKDFSMYSKLPIPQNRVLRMTPFCIFDT